MLMSSPPKFALVVLMLVQIPLHLPKVSAVMDSATDSMESLFGKADGIQLGGSILAVTAMITGAVMLVLGFKLIRAALFVIGVVVGGVAIAMIVERMFRDETWVALASWIAFGAGGVLCGAVATWLYPVSAFFAGAATGVMTAMILTNSFGYMIYPGHTKDLLTLACVVLGILFGALALKVGKPVLIISTSLFGSGMVIWGVGYFTGGFPSANDLEQYASEDVEGKIVYSVPAAWWGYLAGILVLFVFGMYIQFRKTARNVKHQRSKVFGKSMEVAEYIEKKTQRNRNQNSPVMEMPYRQQPRRQMRVREQRQSRHVREVHETREQQLPKKKRAEKQHPPHSIARHPYPDLDAADEIITYEERIPQPKRVIYSERESDLYEFESAREPCCICGAFVHRDSSCCSEKIVRIER